MESVKMKSIKFPKLIFLVLTTILLLGFSVNGFSFWSLTEGEEDIILTRVDSGYYAPYHQIDEGRYGYYESGSFVPVLDFSTSFIIYEPFEWSIVEWEPGPLDADTTQ